MARANRAFTRRAGALTAIAVGPDGTSIYTGGDDGSILRGDTTSGLLRPDGLARHDGPVSGLVVSPDGGRLVSAGTDGSLHIWDLDDRRPVVPTVTGHAGPVLSLTRVPGGTHVVSSGFEGTIQLRDIASGGLVGDPMSAHAGPVFDVAVTVDGRVAAAGVTGALTVWDLYSGRLVGVSAEAHTGPCLAVAVAPDGSRAMTGGEDGRLRIWALDSLRQTEVVDSAPDGPCPVLALGVSPDGRLVVAGLADGRVTTTDLVTGERGLLLGHSDAVRALNVIDDARAASVGDDGSARLWDFATRSEIGSPLEARIPAAPAVTRTGQAPADPSEVPGECGLRDAGVATDNESTVDQLGVTEDVHTMAALLAATGTTPPLSVALLGNWGAGKSTFMRLVRQRVTELARSAEDHPGRTGFVETIWQVRFNAWHYSDDHLWVGIVEHLFRELRERPDDALVDAPDIRRRTELESELAAEKARQGRLDRTLEQVDDLDPDRGWLGWLTQPLRTGLVLRESGRSSFRQLRSWRAVVGLALVAVGVAVVLVAERYGATILGWAAGAATVVTGLLTSVISVWRRVRELTDRARQNLLSERRRGAAEIERLEGELNRMDPARELDRLLTEITSSEHYERYRGLTGRIHHDLERLSDALAAASSTGTERRIILYVDDLDRCVAERVVEVLQAVNLLLSMPLFSVVVAVDPRWLLRALDEHHGTLLNARVPGRTHSLDYLDKIFHVPYALPPMHRRAEGYLRMVLPAVERSTTPGPSFPHAPAVATPPASPPWNPPPPVPPPTPPSGDSYDEPPRAVPPPVEVRTERLRLSMAEWGFLPRLAPLVPTPRAAKKLSNLYRLVRGGVPAPELDAFIGDDEGGPYQAAALLLAAMCSAPGDAEALFSGLLNRGEGTGDIEDVLRSLVGTAPVAATVADLVRDLRAADVRVIGDPREFTTWAVHVARYSFSTYHLFAAAR